MLAESRLFLKRPHEHPAELSSRLIELICLHSSICVRGWKIKEASEATAAVWTKGRLIETAASDVSIMELYSGESFLLLPPPHNIDPHPSDLLAVGV